MKLTLAEPKYLKDSISIISELVNEAQFKVRPEAIELVAMDPANVAMVIFKLLSSSFTEYNVDKEPTIAINLASLKQILRRAKPSDMLTLEIEDNKLKIQFKSDSIRTFHLPIIDIEEREQKVPDLKFPVSIQTNSVFLNEAVEDVDIVAESVSFVAEPKKLTLIAHGDLSNANIEINAGDATKIEAPAKDKIKSKYSVEYLKKMIQGAKLADKVNIQFSKDYPLKLTYNSIDKLMLSFILAPRVESD